MKKSKEEKRRLNSKVKKRDANTKKNAETKEKKLLRKLSPEERKKMMLHELRELEAFEKRTREKILSKLQDKSVNNLDEQREFLEESLKDLDENDIKNHTTIQRVTSLIKQIDLSKNLDFLREFYKEIKEDENLVSMFNPETGKLTDETIDEVYTSYRNSLSEDKIAFLDPEEFFLLLSNKEIPNFDQVKGLWCLYMESNSLLQIGYLITVIVKKIIIEDEDMVAEFVKLGSELT